LGIVMPDDICSLRSHHLLCIVLARLDCYLDTLPGWICVANTTLLENSRHERFHLLLQRFISHMHIQQLTEFPVSTLKTVQELIPNKYRGDLTVRYIGCKVALVHNARL